MSKMLGDFQRQLAQSPDGCLHAKYGVSFSGFVVLTTLKTAIKITTLTKVPIEIVELAMYGSGSQAPADVQHEATLTAVSIAGAGAGTSATPEPFGPNKQVAATSTAYTAATTEPTTYASFSPVLFSFNQRGGMRWAVPRGEGVGSIFENTSMHEGFRVRASTATGAFVDGNLHFWE